ncbi:MAG: DUF1631 family protein [Xanthomonadales bacterium]|nr:DUF1631 family protein [Xanthomonadales bacterium]
MSGVTTSQWSLSGSLGANPVFLRMASTHMAILTTRIDDVLARASTWMTDNAGASTSDDDRAEFFEAAMVLTRSKELIRNTFLGAAGRPLREYCQLGPQSALLTTPQLPAMQAAEMRILDDQDVAEALAFEAMVQRAENKFRQDLHALSVRLAELAAAPRLKSEDNPIGPAKLCEAFQAAMSGVEMALEPRLEIYEVFDRILIRQLDQLYDPLNAQLAEAGIVPEIKWEPRLKRERQRREERAREEAPQDEEATREARRGYLDSWLHGSIQWLLSHRRRQAGDPRDETTPGIENETLQQVLNDLQNRLAVDPEGVSRNIEDIKRLLLDDVAQSGRSEHRQLTLNDENVLDSVGMMFDFMGNDTQLPEPFQLTLSKLQIPYLKAAVRDAEFLGAADAPAKLLLNEMAKAGLGWNAESDPRERLLNKVREITKRIITEYDDDPTVFDELLEDFRRFSERQQKRAELVAKRQSQAMAGKERLRVARRDVGQFLVHQTRSRELPPLVGDLLRKSWAHVMVLTLLRHGKESKQWQQAVATVRELVWSVTFKRNQKAVRRLRTRLPVLAKALAAGLRKVGYSDSEISKLLFNLKKLYTELISRTGSEHVIIEASPDGLVIRGDDIEQFAEDDPTIESVEDVESLSDILDQVQGWRAGQWVMFHREQGEPLRAKLSWISPITGRYLFVNRQGRRAAELSASQLAENLIGERIELLDDEALMTRAMSAVADSLQVAA